VPRKSYATAVVNDFGNDQIFNPNIIAGQGLVPRGSSFF
jgi:hypothetical protein